MNKTHTFNTIHVFWLISHCEKDLWTKVKCRAYHQAWTHCLCDIILLLYLCTTAACDLQVLFTIHPSKTDTWNIFCLNIFCLKFICLRMGASLYKYFCFFHSHTLKGHGNEADFLGFLQKLVPHRSLTLPFERFRFWLRTPGLAESGSRLLNV